MYRRIRLLGPPSVERDGQVVDGPSGRKTWGLLTFLCLAEQPPSRSRLCELLFPEARDPLRALRWNLTELRQVLGDSDVVAGDPLELRLGDHDRIDICEVLSRTPMSATDVAELGGELLEGMVFDGTPAFAAWLDLERHHLRAANEALLAEVAVDELTAGNAALAADLALRAIHLDGYAASHHALLVACLVAMGDGERARAHVGRCRELYRSELDAPLPAEISAALTPTLRPSAAVSPVATVRAGLDAGRAAISAGAVGHGLTALRDAAAAASSVSPSLRAEVLLELGSALVHSAGDRGFSSVRCLQQAYRCAERAGVAELAAHAARELGFVQVQLGRRERADGWLDRAELLAEGPAERSRIYGIRGMNLSDAGHFDQALEACGESVSLAGHAGHVRSQAWSLSMIGRIHLLVGETGQALATLDDAAKLVDSERWAAFSPWTEALRAEARLGCGDLDLAVAGTERAYALACKLADHCWIAVSARALALVSAAHGNLAAALDWVEHALGLEPWYLWSYGWALDAGVALAEAAGDSARACRWGEELVQVTARAQLGLRGRVAAPEPVALAPVAP